MEDQEAGALRAPPAGPWSIHSNAHQQLYRSYRDSGLCSTMKQLENPRLGLPSSRSRYCSWLAVRSLVGLSRTRKSKLAATYLQKALYERQLGS